MGIEHYLEYRWADIGSDASWEDYHGMWARRVAETRYHVLKYINWEDACGGDGPEDGNGKPYFGHMDLVEVDIADTLQRDAALRSYGWTLKAGEVINDYDGEHVGGALVCVYAMASYGAYAPLWSSSGHSARELMRRGARESITLVEDDALYEARMEEPVNDLGSTVREYARGETMAPVLRGIAEGNPAAELALKMYTAAGGQTLGGVSWSRDEEEAKHAKR